MTASASPQVTFIGIGNMGAALVRAYLQAGNRAVIWNRTPTRPAVSELVNAGAKFESSLKDAVSASPVTVLCLLDYGNIHQILDPIATHLAQAQTVINLTNGTPGEARQMSDWMHAQGVKTYIDGGIMAAPYMIATPKSFILCSGEDEGTFANVKNVVEVFGRADYFGSDAGAAALYDIALLAGMYGMFAGGLTAISLLRKARPAKGEDKVLVEPPVKNLLSPLLSAFVASVGNMATAVDSGDYSAHGHPMEMQAIGGENIIRTCKEQGVDVSLLEPMFKIMADVVKEGGGEGGIAQIAKKLV